MRNKTQRKDKSKCRKKMDIQNKEDENRKAKKRKKMVKKKKTAEILKEGEDEKTRTLKAHTWSRISAGEPRLHRPGAKTHNEEVNKYTLYV